MLPAVVSTARTGTALAGADAAAATSRSHPLVWFVDGPSAPISPTQALLVVTLLGAIAYVWYVDGRGEWRSVASERLLYGVPWGTAVSLLVVTAFYLVVQRGLWHWSEPLFLPFVSWSYFYPTGMLTAGIAHASPAHFLSNLAAALVLGPIAEYAWSHHPPADLADRSQSDGAAAETAPGAVSLGYAVLDHPWIRAVVVFPTALFVAAYATSVLSLGPSLGFSGAVFALAGFAVITYPVTTVVAMFGASAIGTFLDALAEPVVRGTVESGPPTPPAWAGIAIQAHFVGFLLGVLFGLAVVSLTDRSPAPSRIFLATLLFGSVQGLWLIVLGGADEVYYLYQGAGFTGLLVLTTVITAAVAGVETDGPALLELPSGRAVRLGAAVVLVGVVALVVLPSPLTGLAVVDESADEPALEGVTVEDYTVTYAEEAPVGYRLPFEPTEGDPGLTTGGVIVSSPDREIWTVAARERVLAYQGQARVAIGDVDWRETVHVERSGWETVGDEVAYAVDLEVSDGERRRVFASEPAPTGVAIDGRSLSIAPGDDGFLVVVSRDGAATERVPVPTANESASAGDLTIRAEERGDRRLLVAEGSDVSAPIAQRETYGE